MMRSQQPPSSGTHECLDGETDASLLTLPARVHASLAGKRRQLYRHSTSTMSFEETEDLTKTQLFETAEAMTEDKIDADKQLKEQSER